MFHLKYRGGKEARGRDKMCTVAPYLQMFSWLSLMGFDQWAGSVWMLSHIQLFATSWTVWDVLRWDPVCIKWLGLRVCEGRMCGPVCGRRWWGNECDWVVSPVSRPELLSGPAKVQRRPEAPHSHSPADWGPEHRWPCGTERSLLRMDCESSL